MADPWSDLCGEALPAVKAETRLVHFEGGEHGDLLREKEARAERRAAKQRQNRERGKALGILSYLKGAR